MAHDFRMTRRVEFADTDTAGVVHFSAFFRFMEEAEHAFYRSLGSSAYQWGPEEVVGMPRVGASCEFIRPLRYADRVEIHVIVREKSRSAIGYEVVFRRLDGDGDTEVARGMMKVVRVVQRHGERDWSPVELPPELAEQIRVAPERPAEGTAAEDAGPGS